MPHGLDRTTGRVSDGIAHLQQSIADILTTRLDTRVMLRDYGSNYPDLIDAPENRQSLVDLYAAVAGAIARWEPRLDLTQVSVDVAEPGHVQLSLKGHWHYDWPHDATRFVEVAL